MKTKFFFLLAVLLAISGLEQAQANDIDTVWMRWMDLSAKYIDISPDAKYIVVSDDGVAELYDLQTGTNLHAASGITRAIFTKDSKYVIGYYGKSIKLIDVCIRLGNI